MNYSDLSSKLTQVIEQIPKDVLYDFCCSYAQEHEELAMALVNEFWRPEKDDYRSMVQQCLMHPTPAGVKNGDGYDWGAIVNIYRMLTSDSSRWCLRTFWGYTSKLAANDSFVNN